MLMPLDEVVRTPLPVLVTLPVTTALLLTKMQLPVAELLLTEATVPPLWVMLQGDTAHAAGAPPPTKSAATELVASRSRARRRPKFVRPFTLTPPPQPEAIYSHSRLADDSRPTNRKACKSLKNQAFIMI